MVSLLNIDDILEGISLRLFCFQAELFTAKTVKKEATEKLHMPNYLEREVRIEVSFMVSIQSLVYF